MRSSCKPLIPLNGCKGTHFFSFPQVFCKKTYTFDYTFDYFIRNSDMDSLYTLP